MIYLRVNVKAEDAFYEQERPPQHRLETGKGSEGNNMSDKTTPRKPRPVHLERALRLCARLRRDSRAYWRKYNMEFDVEKARSFVREAINSAWMARRIYREVVK
jgi:hypothetical protein